MKIRRFRLRGAPRCPVVVEPPPADAAPVGVYIPEARTHDAWGIPSLAHQWAQMNRVMTVLFGVTLPMPKKDAPWSPPILDTAEF